jgi:hypothetical protein
LEESADHHSLDVRGNGNWYLEDGKKRKPSKDWSDEGQPTTEERIHLLCCVHLSPIQLTHRAVDEQRKSALIKRARGIEAN